MTPPEYLTTTQAATVMAIKPSTLSTWRRRRTGPRYIPIGNGPKPRIRYARADIDAWMSRSADHDTTQEATP